MASLSKGIPLTPKQFIGQWQNATHIFELNVWNFEVLVGTAGSHIFRQSFALGRYNSSGSSPWKHTGKTNEGGHPVGSLIEFGDLSQSITYSIKRRKQGVATINIHTNINSFYSHARQYFCYAAIHNEPQSSPLKTGYASRIPQRQFMPTPNDSSDSSVMESKLNELSAAIFMGLPGGRGPVGFKNKIKPTKYHYTKIT